MAAWLAKYYVEDEWLHGTQHESSLVVSGTGDVIEPEDGLCAIGSGGNYALAAARALVRHSTLDARQIAEEAMRVAADICVYTNDRLTIEEIEAAG